MEFFCGEKPLEFRKPVKTITDATSVYLECSNCNEKLVEIVVTHKFKEEFWKVRANCPLCGDKSYVKSIAGEMRFMPGSNKVSITDSEFSQTKDGDQLVLFNLVKNKL